MSVTAVMRRISSGGQLPRTDRTLALDHRIRTVLTTETRGAAALLAATVLALVWANVLYGERRRHGRGGLAAQRSRPADTVLVDLMLPGIDGFECIR